MQVDFLFSGTPAEFGTAAESFSGRDEMRLCLTRFWVERTAIAANPYSPNPVFAPISSDAHSLEIQFRQDSPLVDGKRAGLVAGARINVQKARSGAFITITTSEESWRILERYWTSFVGYLNRIGWEVDGPLMMDAASQSLRGTRTRSPSEHDRIRTTLMTWARRIGKFSSYAAAAEKLGTIDPDTRRNHERDGQLYSDREMEAIGGYEYLWELYTTEYRKS